MNDSFSSFSSNFKINFYSERCYNWNLVTLFNELQEVVFVKFLPLSWKNLTPSMYTKESWPISSLIKEVNEYIFN